MVKEKELILTLYTSSEIIRVAKVAFELAQKRNNKVTSCEKSNVMESGILWREEVQKVRDEEYSNSRIKSYACR